MVGEAARDLYADAQAMLAKIIAEKWLEARGVVGFWPANADGDDIVICADETRRTEIGASAQPAPADVQERGTGQCWPWPTSSRRSASQPDYIGGFAVTAGHGEQEVAKRFKDAGDDYSAILSAALADRLAEAFAEAMHRRVRTELWGYAPDEPFDHRRPDRARSYRGIRPAAGYPAQPDHTEKATCSACWTPRPATGIELTESFAMNPPASVSGLYFAHPQAHYFGVGKIERDQVEDYARRKGWDIGDGRTLARAHPQLHAVKATQAPADRPSAWAWAPLRVWARPKPCWSLRPPAGRLRW